MSDNPLEITEMIDGDTGEKRMWLPLDVLPEDVVQDLRERFVPEQPSAEEAERPPGIKDDADERSRVLMEQAMGQPIGDDDKAAKGDGPVSPADALG